MDFSRVRKTTQVECVTVTETPFILNALFEPVRRIVSGEKNT